MNSLAALITPPGIAGIATIQIRGSDSHSIINKIFIPHPRFSGTSAAVNGLILGEIRDHDEMIDQVIIARNSENESFEINCHGGPRVVQRILMLLRNNNVEIIDWQQLRPATCIADEVELTLPLAKTRLGALAVAAQHPGGLYKWAIESIQSLEACEMSLKEVKEQIDTILQSYRQAERLLSPPAVVIAGGVNAGKSTLANALTGKKQSITSDIPATTRDWTAQLAEIAGLPVNLIDTAGRRENPHLLEQQSLALAEEKIEHAELTVLIVQAGPQAEEQIKEQLFFLPAQSAPLIAVNKSDLIPESQQTSSHLYISALTGTNLEKLRKQISHRLGFENFHYQSPLIFTKRQLDIIQLASEATTKDVVISNINGLVSQR